MNELMFAIDYLRAVAKMLKPGGTHTESCEAAIRVLEDWPMIQRELEEKDAHIAQLKTAHEGVKAQLRRWEKLIEAAGKVGREACLTALTWIPADRLPPGLRALLEALPD